MAKITVTDDKDFNAIADLAGSNGVPLSYQPDTNELEVPDVTKKNLDKALADYEADRATIEAAFAKKRAGKELDREESEFNETKNLKAVVGFLVVQINELRVAGGLSPVTFDFKTEMKKVK